MITVYEVPEATIRLVQDISAGLTRIHRRHPIEPAGRVAAAKARREARERDNRIRRFHGLPVQNEDCAARIADHVIENGVQRGLIKFSAPVRESVKTLLSRNYHAQLRQRRQQLRAASPGTNETQTRFAL